jgi:hypothetical protein
MSTLPIRPYSSTFVAIEAKSAYKNKATGHYWPTQMRQHSENPKLPVKYQVVSTFVDIHKES